MNTDMKNSTVHIPGPKGRFLIGVLPEIRADRIQFLVDAQRNYGDVIRVDFGVGIGIAIFHPDGVKRVMQDYQKNYTKETPAFVSMKPILGNGLFTSNGDFWLRQRRLMQPTFHREKINTLCDMIAQQTGTLLDALESSVKKNQAINISHGMMILTLGITTQALFDLQLEDVDGNLGEMMYRLMGDTIFRFEFPFYPPIWFPTLRNQQLKTAVKQLDKIVYGIFDERRKYSGPKNNLLDMMMAAQLEESEATGGEPRMMTDKQLRDEVVTLMLGGHETTTMNMCWTLYLLSQHPEVEARLRCEVDEVLGGRAPTLEDLPRLEYTRMVRDESMRLYPPAWLTERHTVADDEICGVYIPAGSRLALTQYVTHRHPDFWENPDGFEPERFSAEKSKGRHEFAFFPFAGGGRQCLGKNLALLETHIILAMLIQRYRFEVEPGTQVIREPQLAMRVKDGLFMRLKPA
ncbi:MAG: cytochrome P450 [Chloroflexota bacterium]